MVVARGLPYGRADRFQPARPVAPWTGELDCTRPGPACPQLPSRLAWVTGSAVGGLAVSEDCLVLSITAPADAHDLPVMVWFHGGAYVTGSGESPLYEATSLARDGEVVVVSVSYRLGILGYLAPEAPNLGLRDQILALRWVADNVAAFGGDPARVTVFGQSAGGDSVISLLMCESARGLFSRAIVQSAPLGIRDGRGPMTAAMRRAVEHSLAPTNSNLATTDQLLEAQTAAIVAAQQFPTGGMAFGPIEGEDPLPSVDVADERLLAAASDVEIVIGYTKHDAAPFLVRGSADPAVDPDSAEVTAATEAIFGKAARDLADAWRANGGRVLTYRVDWAPAGAPLGACHCIELPLLFGTPSTWSAAGMLGTAPNPIDQELSRETRTHWTEFAHHGVAAWDRGSVRFG